MVALAFVSITVLLLSEPALAITVPRILTGATPRSVEARPRDGAPSAADRSSVAGAEEPALEPPVETAVAVAEERGPSASGLAVGGRARVANTAGAGVILHAAPRVGARRPAGLLDGTPVAVMELVGEEWVRVRSDANLEGWVPVAYLVPAH
jgi:hypothetical protein